MMIDLYDWQWRIQDLKEGGARSIVRKARAQKSLATPLIYATKKAVLGLVAMRKRCLRSEF